MLRLLGWLVDLGLGRNLPPSDHSCSDGFISFPRITCLYLTWAANCLFGKAALLAPSVVRVLAVAPRFPVNSVVFYGYSLC